jgi:YrbI family 3-deoxy-D-manno-octulosonate 8-phosphate phosphatase|tara:strand:- start:626 stop:1108 length:483 start_codon:yes stop_codon:yes gene_type:complete
MDFSRINLIVYDFDGVMTDNKVYVDQNGNEMVRVNRADGLGIAKIKKLGIEQIIISTETNLVVSARAKKLGIHYLQGIKNKKITLIDYCNKHRIDLQNVLFIGNDINDKEVMEIVGFKMCPSDAYQEIKKIVDHVLKSKGGEGVVREIYSIIKQRKFDNE